MAKTLTLAALSYFVFLVSPSYADIVVNGSFEMPNIPDNSFTLNPGPTAIWEFAGNSGIIDAPSGYGVPTPPDGDQVALLQHANVPGSFSNFLQSISLPSDGMYSLSFLDAGRSNLGGNVGYNVTLDASMIYSDATTTAQPFTFKSTDFFASAGTYELKFQTTGDIGDHSAFFDSIVVTSVPEPNCLALLLTATASAALRRKRNRDGTNA